MVTRKIVAFPLVCIVSVTMLSSCATDNNAESRSANERLQTVKQICKTQYGDGHYLDKANCDAMARRNAMIAGGIRADLADWFIAKRTVIGQEIDLGHISREQGDVEASEAMTVVRDKMAEENQRDVATRAQKAAAFNSMLNNMKQPTYQPTYWPPMIQNTPNRTYNTTCIPMGMMTSCTTN